MTLDQYLELPHGAAAPTSGTRPGMVDRMLAEKGYTRRVVAWVPYLNTLPRILAQSDLVLTNSGHMAFQFARQAEHRWLRELIREAANRQLKRPASRRAAVGNKP